MAVSSPTVAALATGIKFHWFFILAPRLVGFGVCFVRLPAKYYCTFSTKYQSSLVKYTTIYNYCNIREMLWCSRLSGRRTSEDGVGEYPATVILDVLSPRAFSIIKRQNPGGCGGDKMRRRLPFVVALGC